MIVIKISNEILVIAALRTAYLKFRVWDNAFTLPPFMNSSAVHAKLTVRQTYETLDKWRNNNDSGPRNRYSSGCGCGF